jgi:predicted GNAT superfamily acetyltransferase
MLDVRPLESILDLECATDLEIAVWDVDPRGAVPASLMHASILSGGIVLGAFDRERMVGMSYAFPARRGTKWMLWSHMTGVHRDYQGQGIGFRLKQAQRHWALQHGYSCIAWTFDPLQRGNAHFNLHLLGATAGEYHVDFYGQMTDAININLPSDRLEARWDLRSTHVSSLAEGNGSGAVVGDYPDDRFLLRVGDSGHPLVREAEIVVPSCFVEIPFELAQLKLRTLDLAYNWRIALRRVLQDAFVRGYILTDFIVAQGRCWYVLSEAVPWYLYVLECGDGSLYTGVTSDVPRRMAQHNAGKGAAFTASRRPVKLVATWQFAGRGAALHAEMSFKRLSRRRKLEHVEEGLSYLGAPFLLFGMK